MMNKVGEWRGTGDDFAEEIVASLPRHMAQVAYFLFPANPDPLNRMADFLEYFATALPDTIIDLRANSIEGFRKRSAERRSFGDGCVAEGHPDQPSTEES